MQVDSETPGLSIEESYADVVTLRLTDSRRRNPLTRGLLHRMREFLRGEQQQHQDQVPLSLNPFLHMSS